MTALFSINGPKGDRLAGRCPTRMELVKQIQCHIHQPNLASIRTYRNYKMIS